jgi:hypothetical protein
MDRKLQVFVSSTFTDLIDERQAAVSAILKAGHMPAGMELFTAGNKSQWDTITKWIDESDVYVLILGGRYGSVEEVSGLSYTELEYDYAVSQGKPFFAIVAKDEAINEKIKAHGRDVIEQIHPAKLAAFRRKVLNSISTFFVDSKDIRIAIMESLMHISDIHAQAGWVRASKVSDTKGLDDIIVRLTADNAALNKRLETANSDSGDDNYGEIEKVLLGTLVAVPPELVSVFGGATSVTLMRACLAYLDALVGGVYNGTGQPRSWIFGSVSPKLILHGLAREEIAGTRGRKLSEKGLAFFSEYRKRTL